MGNFRKFENQKSPDGPSITIRKNGTICLNRKTVELFKVDGFRAAALYNDQKESVIGIKPVKDGEDSTAFRLSKEKARTFTISCRAFLKHIGVAFAEGSKIYPATWDEKRGMILVKVG
jgi:hypothetical protein